MKYCQSQIKAVTSLWFSEIWRRLILWNTSHSPTERQGVVMVGTTVCSTGHVFEMFRSFVQSVEVIAVVLQPWDTITSFYINSDSYFMIILPFKPHYQCICNVSSNKPGINFRMRWSLNEISFYFAACAPKLSSYSSRSGSPGSGEVPVGFHEAHHHVS